MHELVSEFPRQQQTGRGCSVHVTERRTIIHSNNLSFLINLGLKCWCTHRGRTESFIFFPPCTYSMSITMTHHQPRV